MPFDQAIYFNKIYLANYTYISILLVSLKTKLMFEIAFNAHLDQHATSLNFNYDGN